MKMNMGNDESISRGNLYNLRSRGSLKGNKNSQEIFYEASLNLFRLLAHHPYFRSEISKLRNKYGIVSEDIKDMGGILIWKNENRDRYRKLLADPLFYNLPSDFKFASQLRKAVAQFTLDYVLTGEYTFHSSYESGYNVIRPTKKLHSIELSPKSIYLEITPETSLREVKDNWDKIVGGRKEVRNFGIPSPSRIDEYVWELTTLHIPKLEQDEIKKRLKQRFSGYSFTYSEINKRKHTYRMALSKLRKVTASRE